MSLIIVLILGAIIGWLGARLVGREEGIIGSIVIGVIGAFLGNAIAHLFGRTGLGYMAFSWSAFFWALIGSIIFSAVLNVIQHRSTRHHI